MPFMTSYTVEETDWTKLMGATKAWQSLLMIHRLAFQVAINYLLERNSFKNKFVKRFLIVVQ